MVRDSHIFVTMDPAGLLNIMLRSHGPDFNYQIIESREADVPEGMATMSSARVTRFGWNRMGKGKRKGKAMHIVWSITDMMRDPSKVLNDGSPESMMKFAIDVRDWCKDNNLPLPTALSGIASSLLRDERFYPDARGRIPQGHERAPAQVPPGCLLRASRKALRHPPHRRVARSTPGLPPRRTGRPATGLHHPLRTRVLQRPRQRPTLGRQGRRRLPPHHGTARPRARAGTSRPTMPKSETRPPPSTTPGVQDVYLWTNEVPLCEETGLDIHGIVAAWTSTHADEGIPATDDGPRRH
jgi:hypothetical protein